MQDIVHQVQTIEQDKKEFERELEREFIEQVLSNDSTIKTVLNSALSKMNELSGEETWNILAQKLNLYKDDETTVFVDPIPNKAGALIKSWMQRDMEMNCEIRINGISGSSPMYMIVTRWGFVQIFETLEEIMPVCQFYIYDYEIVQHGANRGNLDGLLLRLQVRQHRTFAPLKGIAHNYNLMFSEKSDLEKFIEVMNEFQQTQAPQT